MRVTQGAKIGLLVVGMFHLSCTKPNPEFADPRLNPTAQDDATGTEAGAACTPVLCFSVNADENVATDARLSAQATALPLSIPDSFGQVSRVEVMTGALVSDNRLALHLSNQDGSPGMQVASAPLRIGVNVEWQGVDFRPAVELDNQAAYILVWEHDDTGAQQASKASSGQEVSALQRRDDTATWSPERSPWMARVYCCEP